MLNEGLIQGATNQRDALVVEVLRVGTSQLASLLSNQRLCLCRRVSGVEELVDGTEVNRHGVHDAIVVGVHTVHVVREVGKAVHVLPHALVGGVEQVGAVAVHLDAGLLFLLAVCVTANVGATVQQSDFQAQLGGGLFCDGQAEEARSDNYEVSSQCFLLYYHGVPAPIGMVFAFQTGQFPADSGRARSARAGIRRPSHDGYSHTLRYPLINWSAYL